jgi:hypothetical protein
MKALLFASLAAAHSGVWTITFDGNKYVPEIAAALTGQIPGARCTHR